MRTLLVLALVFGAQLGILPVAARAQSAADNEAIRKVLLAETDHFFARNFEAWAATFVQVPSATQAWNNADGSYVYRHGWDTISARIREFMKNNPKPDPTPLHRENFDIRHYGNAAFVTFDKYMGDRQTAKPIRELRVVERVGAEWKIVLVAALIDHVKAASSDD